MNRARKGKTKELAAKHELEEKGWRIIFKSYTLKLGPIFKGIDFADLFDIVAIKDYEWLFLSVSHLNAHPRSHLTEIIKFAEEHGVAGSYQLWEWDKPRWRGRGKNKRWHNRKWRKHILAEIGYCSRNNKACRYFHTPEKVNDPFGEESDVSSC